MASGDAVAPLSPAELSALQLELINHVLNSRDWRLPASEAATLLARAVQGQVLREALGERAPLPVSYDGLSLLQHAHRDGSAQLVRVLRRVGASLPSPDQDGNTALHCAALADDLSALAAALAAAPADVAACNSHRRTPLHCAALQGGAACTRLLLAAGACTRARDISGRTARELAQNYMHKTVVEALDEHAAGPPVRAGAPQTARGAGDGPPRRTVHRESGESGLTISVSAQPGAGRCSGQQPRAAGGGGGAAAAADSRSRMRGGGNEFVPWPFPQLGVATNRDFDAHAEALAAAYMRWLGFADAAAGGIHEPDGGVDVRSRGAVAQVKANVRAHATPRAHLAQFYGDAATIPGNPRLLFFAIREYSPDAIEYAAKPQVAMCLFCMDVLGRVQPANDAARMLLAER